MDIFYERQKFTQWWLWLIVGSVLVIPLLVMFYQIFLFIFEERSLNSTKDIGQIIVLAINALIGAVSFFFLRSIRLETQIDENEIRFRFYPFDLSFRKLNWSDIQEAKVIEYHPIKDYGGWGLRWGKKGRAFNVAGNKGLQLLLKSGKGIMIGTQKPAEMDAFLIDLETSRPREKSW